MSNQEALLHELDAHRQIHAAITHFARGVDRCDREMILSAFHPDGWDDHGVFSGPAEAFADWVIPVHRSMVWTAHYNTNVDIELDGDTARSETYVIANLRYQENGSLCDLFGCGRYFDRFERRDGKWLIAHRHAISDWNRVDKVEQQASGPVVDLLDRGRRDTNDPGYAHFAGTRPERRPKLQPAGNS